MRTRDRGAARPHGDRHLRPVGDHGPRRRLRMRVPGRPARLGGPFPVRGDRSGDRPARCPKAKPGELVITTLTKEALPMLRYRTRDITRVTTAPCDCGRTHLRILRITGRNDDMLIIRGVNVYPSQVEAVLVGLPDIAPHYQLVVERHGSLDHVDRRGRGAARRRRRARSSDIAQRRRASHQVADRHHHRRHRQAARRDPALAGQGGARARPAAEGTVTASSMTKRIVSAARQRPPPRGRGRRLAAAARLPARARWRSPAPSAAATAASAARARCWSTASRGSRASRSPRAAPAGASRRSRGSPTTAA